MLSLNGSTVNLLNPRTESVGLRQRYRQIKTEREKERKERWNWVSDSKRYQYKDKRNYSKITEIYATRI